MNCTRALAGDGQGGFGQIERHRRIERLLLRPCQHEQLQQQPFQGLDRVPNIRQRGFALGRSRAEAIENVEVDTDHSQRRAHLMGGVASELPQRADRPLVLGNQRVEGLHERHDLARHGGRNREAEMCGRSAPREFDLLRQVGEGPQPPDHAPPDEQQRCHQHQYAAADHLQDDALLVGPAIFGIFGYLHGDGTRLAGDGMGRRGDPHRLAVQRIVPQADGRRASPGGAAAPCPVGSGGSLHRRLQSRNARRKPVIAIDAER